MKKVSLLAVTLIFSIALFAQNLDDARKEIDNENYFKARQILFKLINDPAQNKAEIAYYLGDALIKSDDVDSSRIFYKMVYNPDSKDPLGYVALGRIQLLDKNLPAAKTSFDRALQLTKFKNATIYYEIGDAYFRPNVIDISAAINNLEEARKLDYKNTTVMLALGDAYLLNSANDNQAGGKAMNLYEDAVAVDPKLAMAWIKMGRLDVNGRIYNDAITAFQKALQIDQRFPIIYKELAIAYYWTKDYEKFKQNYQKYIELSPGDNDAKATLINIYFQGKDYQNVIDEASKGLKNDSNDYIFQRALLYANYELKHYKDANDASQMLMKNPNKKIKDLDIIYAARAAAAVGDTTAAINYFTQALSKDSANCDFLGEFAKVLFQAHRYPDAIAEYNLKKAKCGKLGSIEVYYLGLSYVYNGDSTLADSAFLEFADRNPTSPDGYFQLARINLKLGKPEDFMSLPYYQKFIELAQPDSAKYKAKLVEAYLYVGVYSTEKQKDNAKAKEYFSKALELDPSDPNAIEFMKQLK